MKKEEIIKKLDEIKSSIEENTKASNAMRALKIINKYIHFNLFRSDDGKYYLGSTIMNVGYIQSKIEIKEYEELFKILENLYL